MTIFETVKTAVPVRAAAERYGLRVNSHGMARCPFHDDKHPSLKLNDDYFYCFGCGATGDVTEFTAKLFGLPRTQAAQKLMADFGIPEKKPSLLAMLHRIPDETRCLQVLRDYLHILEDWKIRYAPKTPDETPHPHFVEACQMLDCIRHMVTLLTSSKAQECAALAKSMMEDDKITRLADYVRRVQEVNYAQT